MSLNNTNFINNFDDYLYSMNPGAVFPNDDASGFLSIGADGDKDNVVQEQDSIGFNKTGSDGFPNLSEIHEDKHENVANLSIEMMGDNVDCSNAEVEAEQDVSYMIFEQEVRYLHRTSTPIIPHDDGCSWLDGTFVRGFTSSDMETLISEGDDDDDEFDGTLNFNVFENMSMNGGPLKRKADDDDSEDQEGVKQTKLSDN